MSLDVQRLSNTQTASQRRICSNFTAATVGIEAPGPPVMEADPLTTRPSRPRKGKGRLEDGDRRVEVGRRGGGGGGGGGRGGAGAVDDLGRRKVGRGGGGGGIEVDSARGMKGKEGEGL